MARARAIADIASDEVGAELSSEVDDLRAAVRFAGCEIARGCCASGDHASGFGASTNDGCAAESVDANDIGRADAVPIPAARYQWLPVASPATTIAPQRIAIASFR